MKIQNLSLLIMSITISTLGCTFIVHGAPKTQFSIVYTNDVMGEVEPCG